MLFLFQSTVGNFEAHRTQMNKIMDRNDCQVSLIPKCEPDFRLIWVFLLFLFLLDYSYFYSWLQLSSDLDTMLNPVFNSTVLAFNQMAVCACNEPTDNYHPTQTLKSELLKLWQTYCKWFSNVKCFVCTCKQKNLCTYPLIQKDSITVKTEGSGAFLQAKTKNY